MHNTHGKHTGCGRPAALLAVLIPALLFAAAWVPTGHAAPAAPGAVAPAAAAPKAYVALRDECALAVLDTGTNRVLRFIPVPLGPYGVAVTPDGRKVYVGSDQLSVVSILDTATDGIVGQFEVGRSPSGLSVSPEGRQLLVSVSGANEVAIIDTRTDLITDRVPVARPDRSAISPDGRIAYVGSASLDAPALAVIDLRKRTKIGTVALTHVPRALAFSPDGRRLYFTADGEDTVQVLDPERNKIVAAIPARVSPRGLILAALADGTLVVGRSPNVLEILDPLRDIASGTVAVGRLPYGIAIGADKRTAYVTDQRSGDVSVIDLVDRKVQATIPIDTSGGSLGEIVVQPRPIVGSARAEMPRTSRSVDGTHASRILDVQQSRPGSLMLSR